MGTYRFRRSVNRHREALAKSSLDNVCYTCSNACKHYEVPNGFTLGKYNGRIMKNRTQTTPLLLLATLAASLGSVHAAITINTPHVFRNDYGTVLLRWNSETGAVYQVESADAIGTEGAQGYEWMIRETDCASKGTNSEWLDVGDTRWIPRVFHPVHQGQRFYRVQKIGQADLPPPAVSIQLSQSNQISGWLNVSVSTTHADTNNQLSSVGVFVDGQRVRTAPIENFSTWINTTEWPNGPHEIYAVATTVDGGETIDTDDSASTNVASMGIGVSTSRIENFENYISQFFVAVPYFDPVAGQTQEVTAVFAEDSYWRITVVDYQDTEVRRFEGQGTSCFAAWDGNDQFGTPLPFGFYDYIIEARPSQYGPLSLIGSGSSSAMMTSQSGKSAANQPFDFAAEYKQTPQAMRFPRATRSSAEKIEIPSLAPQKPAVVTLQEAKPLAENGKTLPTSPEDAMMAGLTSYFIEQPPFPPVTIEVKGEWITVPWEEAFGPQPPTEVKISEEEQEKFLQELEQRLKGLEIGQQANEPQVSSWGDATYMTRSPTRFPGSLFMGYAGTVGIGFQGHHPNGNGFSIPVGGIISGDQPPYGALLSASAIANWFSINMGLGGWRTSFYLGNDKLRVTNITYAANRVGTFAAKCDFGLIIGHMTASQNASQLGATHSYFPLYNADISTTSYQWLALPRFDLGQVGRPDTLKWMGLYGCFSLRQQDFNDMWTKFLVPMPPNVRLLLGSENGVFIHPIFGSRLAANMHGWTSTNGVPMTIVQSWYDAARAADTETAKSFKWRYRMGTRVMTTGYRTTLLGGSWNTINDSIWNYGSDISYDWFDLSHDSTQVYP